MSDWISSLIRSIPDYPIAGVQFRDITTLMKDARGFQRAVDELAEPYAGLGLTKVAGIEARGFILGGAVAHRLGTGFVPVRKPGKLPAATLGVDYSLEYGSDRLEIHLDAVTPEDRVLIIDDLIATGGTVLASLDLLRTMGCAVVGAAFIINLPELGGAARVESAGCPVRSLCDFPGH